MKIHDILLEKDPSAMSMRALKKQMAQGYQQASQNRNLTPGERADLVNPRNVKQQQAELKQQKQAQAAVQQTAGVPEITKDNVMKVLPALLKKAMTSDKALARNLMNAVATAASPGEEMLAKAEEMQKRRSETKAEGGKWNTKEQGYSPVEQIIATAQKQQKTVGRAGLKSAAQAIDAMANRLPEAQQAPQPAAAAPSAQPQQPAKPAMNANKLLIAQIQAAVKQLTPDQRVTLKSQIQHIARGGDAAIGRASLRGVPQRDVDKAKAGHDWKHNTRQQVKATGQQIKKDFTSGVPTFKKWAAKAAGAFKRGTP